MTQFANAMEIFKLLNKSNCRKCNETTCLAFASKVFLGQKKLDQCPFIDPPVLKEYQKGTVRENPVESHQKQLTADLKQRIQSSDLKEAAERTGGVISKGRLSLRIFGKPFAIDEKGNMFSDIHMNSWIVPPVMGYVLECKGAPLTGQWIPFRELNGGREKNGLFVQRSEIPFRQIADRYPNLFEDLILIFNGTKTQNMYDSDISLVLHPLPRLPILVCYWKPEDDMDSDLHLFFDSSADQNAGIDIVYTIAAGIVVMFEKISKRHGSGIV